MGVHHGGTTGIKQRGLIKGGLIENGDSLINGDQLMGNN